jgi:phosphoglucomutase
MNVSSMAGKPAQASMLVDITKLVTSYYAERPDPQIREQRVVFGTSGHRGSSSARVFNEWHILAVTQAICNFRKAHGVDGPLFIGFDTHALSRPAFTSALEVLAANGVETMISQGDEPTPTPAVSHAILIYNRNRTNGLADGIVITPSHNPPEDGGFKYNPPNGGPAGSDITRAIQDTANKLLEAGLNGVRRTSIAQAINAPNTHEHDYITAYVSDLGAVLDMDAIRGAGLKLGVDPLGGAGVHYWHRIAERYGLNLTIVNEEIDYTFRFMTVDWDGKIRMDPSSPYAMQSLIALGEKFDVAFACDTDHDRHGIVTKRGLMPPNHYLSACIEYLYSHRSNWSKTAAVGKTVVSSSMIDRVADGLGRRVYEVPVGFKYFVDCLKNGSIGFSGEESAGASFLRRDGTVWTTDKDGIIAALLSAEMTAIMKRDPGEVYAGLTSTFGNPVYERTDAPANAQEKLVLQNLSPESIRSSELAGEPILKVLTHAPGDGNAIGGVKVIAANGWFAARPSGTEDVYKIYAESFLGEKHLRRIQAEAREIVAQALSAARPVVGMEPGASAAG